MQRRILKIQRNLPMLTPEMYGDLIELSRPEIYPPYFEKMATDILYLQIDSGNGPAVALGLTQISLSEAEMIIGRLFASREHDLLARWYKRAPLAKGRLFPDVTLDFLAILIQLRTEMTSACCAVIDHLCRNPDICVRLLHVGDHPILRIHGEESLNIPYICRISLSELQLNFFPNPMYRWNNWKWLDRAGRSAESRLLQLDRVMLKVLAENLYAGPDFFDAAVDLFDFIRYSATDLLHAATDQLITYISITRECWEPLGIVLSLSSRYLPPLSTVLGYDLYVKNPEQKFNPLLYEFLRLCYTSRSPLSTGDAPAVYRADTLVRSSDTSKFLKNTRSQEVGDTAAIMSRTTSHYLQKPLEPIPEADETSID
ncbi:hypothetical protein MVEN_02356700 [Mycena venus]|uniref:Uncharacterized protein n=1 Tax=Mycena venus TaxID=2733690 RepID=A0A8H6X3K9_9AGAR|nr:hypothetical protein MVEN_02356700 [Mycena venus]